MMKNRIITFPIIVLFLFLSCKKERKTNCTSDFIENTCTECLGLKDFITVTKTDSLSCKYLFAVKLSPKYLMTGRIWEEEEKIYYDGFNDSPKLLIPFNIHKKDVFNIQLDKHVYNAECEDIIFDVYLQEKIYIYKYYNFYPLTEKTDMTFFVSPQRGLLGFFISHKGSDEINRIIGIYGNIFVNRYNYEMYRLGGYL